MGHFMIKVYLIFYKYKKFLKVNIVKKDLFKL